MIKTGTEEELKWQLLLSILIPLNYHLKTTLQKAILQKVLTRAY